MLWTLACLVLLTGGEWAWAAGNQTINTLPGASSNLTVYQQFMRNETPAVLSRYYPDGWVASGGTHSTAGSCTSGSFSVEAFTSSGNRVLANTAGGSTSIDYSVMGCNCSNPGSDTAFVIASGSSSDTLGNFQRVTGTNLFVNCTDTSQPSLPADSAWLMQVYILNGALSRVVSLTPIYPAAAQAMQSLGGADVTLETQLMFGASQSAYVLSGCAPTVPSSSLTFAAFACTALVRDGSSPARLIPVTQASATVSVANTNGTHWLAVCQDASSAVSSWTREPGTHYVHRQTASDPGSPTGCLRFARVTVASNVISAVLDMRATNPVRGLVLNAKDPAIGFLGDGSNETAKFAIAAGLLEGMGAGSTLFFPPGTYMGNNSTALISLTSGLNGLTIECAGMGATTIKQEGSGNGIAITNASSFSGTAIRHCTLDGNNAGAKGIDTNQMQDGVIEHNNIVGFLDHAIDLRGLNNLHNIIRDNRISAGVGALSSGRGVNAVGNINHIQHNYFNIGNNSNRYNTALDVIGCGGCTSSHNTFDGVPTAIRSRLGFTSTSDWFDTTSGGTVSITTAYIHDANNVLAVLSPVNISLSHVSFTGSDRRYLTFIAPNDVVRSVMPGVFRAAVISPTALAGNVNDYEPTGGEDAFLWGMDAGGTTRTITGIAKGYEGRHITIYNVGTGDLIFSVEDAASTATNRIQIAGGQNYRLQQRASVTLFYTQTAIPGARWRITDNKPAFIGTLTYAQNFAAPAASPGCVESGDLGLTGAVLGDIVTVAADIAIPADFAPVMAYVRTADVVRIKWCQLSGAAADPDGGGTNYNVHLWKNQ